MNAVSQWIEAHPNLVAIVIWPTLTAIVTYLLKPRTAAEYEALPPRVAGILRLIGGLGLDVPNVMKAICVILTGKQSPPLAPAPLSVSKRPPPKDPPDSGGGGFGVLVAPIPEARVPHIPSPTDSERPTKKTLLLAVAIMLTGCSHAAQSAANGMTAAEYTREQNACIDKATSHEEADACRCAVKAKYGNPCVGGRP